MIKNINDPEHPLTLEQLNIVSVPQIKIDDDKRYIKVYFTPTIPNCSMSTLIGLMIKVKLLNCVSNLYKVNFYLMIFKGRCFYRTRKALYRRCN